MSKKIIIYTDGSCLENPGQGGLGIVLKYGNHLKEIAIGYRKTTNNRMELLAVIEALRNLKKQDIDIIVHSDSKYVINAVEKGWVFGWEKKNFKKKKNADLWKQFLELYPKFKIQFKWVKGHAGVLGNERCDLLARNAASNPTEIDTEYEKLENASSENSIFDL